MNRKTRGRRLSLAILVALFLIFSPCLASAYTYAFRAYIDGDADLIIQGNTVQWHNNAYDVPGITMGNNYPTTITTADMGSVDWYPVWPGGTTGDQWSNKYTDLDLPLPASDQNVTLNVTEKRDSPYASVSIVQYPLLDNDYTLIVEFDDWVDGGAAWYTVEVNTTPVPLPGSVWLFGSCFLYLTHFWRRKLAFSS